VYLQRRFGLKPLEVPRLTLERLAELLEEDRCLGGPPEATSSAESPATADADDPPTTSTLAPQALSLATDREALAIALLFKHPEMKLEAIAELVGVIRQTFYKWPKLYRAASLAGKIKPRYEGQYPVARGRYTKRGEGEKGEGGWELQVPDHRSPD
jgi:hypothetical protein